MRYSKEHKQETHARIVKKASVRLREKGAHGIGVADLMKEAGLTHGGFYAHFDSREALVIEARSAGTLEIANYLCPGNTGISGAMPVGSGSRLQRVRMPDTTCGR